MAGSDSTAQLIVPNASATISHFLITTILVSANGYSGALPAIIDANMAHLIACAILFQLGSGPIRGFAVTLGIGVLVSWFTAILLTRLMIVSWYRRRRPRALTL